MRALITGIAGFVGSHLADHLLGLGADVYGIDLKPRDDGAHSGNKHFRVFVGDLWDDLFLSASLREINPTHVFHLAGILGSEPSVGQAFSTK